MSSRNLLIVVIAASVLFSALMVCGVAGCIWWQHNHYLELLDKASKI